MTAVDVGVDGAAVAVPAAVIAKPRKPVSIWRPRALRVASILAAVGLWQLLTAGHVRFWLRFDTLPTVTEIVGALTHAVGTHAYWLDLGQSLVRILTGFGLAAVVGVASGILLGRSRLASDLLGPLT